MAKVTITITDEAEEDQVTVHADFDPPLNNADENAVLTSAQAAAFTMMNAVSGNAGSDE